MLNDNPVVMTQIKDLDRCRNRVIRRANNKLDKLHSRVGGSIPKEGNQKSNNTNDQSSIDYYGRPFSY